MQYEQFTEVVYDIEDFLEEYGIAKKMRAVYIEREWTDVWVTIKDPKQMERIDLWLRDDLKRAIADWHDIEIAAPHPLPEYSDQLRVRIYYLQAAD